MTGRGDGMSRRLKQQGTFYDRRAPTFDRRHLGGRTDRNHRAKLELIRRWLDLASCHRVLEIGTGTGVHARWLLDSCDVQYVGVDLSPGMLNMARKRLGRAAQLVAAPGEVLPFASDSFDGAFCSGTLHHAADKAETIVEMARVTRPGGRVVLSEPNPVNPLNLKAWLLHPEERGDLDIRPGRLRDWFARAGLRLVHAEFFNFTPAKPQCLASWFGRADAVLARVPVVRRIGSMILFVGECPQGSGG